MKDRAPRPAVAPVLAPDPDLPEEPGEQRPVDGRRLGRGRARAQPHVVQQGEDLLVGVVPLPHAHVGEETVAAELAEFRPGEMASLLVVEIPQPEQAEEVRPAHVKFAVGGVGRRPRGQGALARVLDLQGADDDQHLREAAQIPRGQQHPAEPRVYGKPREVAPERGQATLPVDRPDLGQ